MAEGNSKDRVAIGHDDSQQSISSGQDAVQSAVPTLKKSDQEFMNRKSQGVLLSSMQNPRIEDLESRTQSAASSNNNLSTVVHVDSDEIICDINSPSVVSNPSVLSCSPSASQGGGGGDGEEDDDLFQAGDGPRHIDHVVTSTSLPRLPSPCRTLPSSMESWEEINESCGTAHAHDPNRRNNMRKKSSQNLRRKDADGGTTQITSEDRVTSDTRLNRYNSQKKLSKSVSDPLQELIKEAPGLHKGRSADHIEAATDDRIIYSERASCENLRTVKSILASRASNEIIIEGIRYSKSEICHLLGEVSTLKDLYPKLTSAISTLCSEKSKLQHYVYEKEKHWGEYKLRLEKELLAIREKNFMESFKLVKEEKQNKMVKMPRETADSLVHGKQILDQLLAQNVEQQGKINELKLYIMQQQMKLATMEERFNILTETMRAGAQRQSLCNCTKLKALSAGIQTQDNLSDILVCDKVHCVNKTVGNTELINLDLFQIVGVSGYGNETLSTLLASPDANHKSKLNHK